MISRNNSVVFTQNSVLIGKVTGVLAEFAKTLDLVLVPYENKDGMKATVEALSQLKNVKSVGIFIGPEGGFDEKEITKTLNIDAKIISLGKRILRTETAAITSVAMCMLEIEKENNE